MAYRGARALMEGGGEVATRQRNADTIADKGQRVRRAAAAAKTAKELAVDHEGQLATGVLRQLDLGEMALLNRLNGLLPNRNLATLEDAAKIGDGVVAARAMLAQDAALFNLWAQNAMIRSAKVETLVADKLAAGTFTAGNIVLAGGGAVKAGATTLDSSGMYLAALSSWTGAAANREYKITSLNSTQAIGFFDDAGASTRGIGVRAEGFGSTRAGAIVLNAIRTQGDSVFAADSAWLHILSTNEYRGSQVYMGRRVYVDGRIEVSGGIDIDGVLNPNGGIDPAYYCFTTTVSGNGGRTIWDHNLGTSALHVQFQASVPGTSSWKPIEHISGLQVDNIGAAGITVENNSGIDRNVRGWIHRIANV